MQRRPPIAFRRIDSCEAVILEKCSSNASVVVKGSEVQGSPATTIAAIEMSQWPLLVRVVLEKILYATVNHVQIGMIQCFHVVVQILVAGLCQDMVGSICL